MRWMVLVLACLLSVSPGLADEAPIAITTQLDQQWLDVVISIEQFSGDAGNPEVSIGTGFLVGTDNRHLVLATARHVVIENEEKFASGKEPPKVRVDLIYRVNVKSGGTKVVSGASLREAGGGEWFISGKHDLAVRFFKFLAAADLKSIPLNRFLVAEQVQAGTPLAVLGFPMGLRSTDHARPIARHGTVARADPENVIAEAFVFPGNSGGPALYAPTSRLQVSRGGVPMLTKEMLAGLVTSFIGYRDIAISKQTGRPRVVFEENSGLVNLVPAWAIREFVTSGKVRELDLTLPK
jgi:hypothetical protein